MTRIAIGVIIMAAAFGASGWLACREIWDGFAATMVVAVAAVCYLWRQFVCERKRVGLLLETVKNHDSSMRFSGSDTIVDSQLNEIAEILHAERLKAHAGELAYRMIINNIHAAVIVCDAKGFVKIVNRAALEMFGLEVLSHIENLGRIDERLPQQLLTALPGERLRFNLPSAAKIIMLVGEAKVGDENLRIFVAEDINVELQGSETESWSKLTRVLIHEITNSLTPIVSISSSLAADRSLSPEICRGLEAVKQTGEGLMEFVATFRNFSQRPTANLEVFDVSPFLRAQAEIIRANLPENIELSLAVTPADLVIYADRQLTSRVISNIVNNAVKAIGDNAGGEIRLTAFVDSAQNVIIDIANNGEPIAEENVENIFTPFFTTRTDGHGIGLALCRTLMRSQSGLVSLLPPGADGRTVFRLTFQ